MDTIAKPFGWLLLFLYNLVSNYGIALILFALIVRLILLPFTMKSKKSMMRQTRLQPVMKELEAKYAGNKQKYQEEVAKLYKQEKINPMGGCLWSLIPFPILIALYQAIRFPITIMMGVAKDVYEGPITTLLGNLGFVAGSNTAYLQIAQSQFINQHFDQFKSLSEQLQTINYSFLGIDLGANPSFRVWEFFSNGQALWPQLGLFLIPIISALLSYFSMKISNKVSGTSMEQAGGGGKGMMLMMPIISLWIGFIMPGALGLYWLAGSVFQILQDVVLTKHYKKKLDAEDAERREQQAAIEAEHAARHAETERKRAEGTTVTNPNTSKRKLAMQEKQRAEENDVERAIARGELARTNSGKLVKTGKTREKDDPARVGDRPYARGRNYKPDRFQKGYVPEPEGEETAEAVSEETAAAGTVSEETAVVETASEGAEIAAEVLEGSITEAAETALDPITEGEIGTDPYDGTEAGE